MSELADKFWDSAQNEIDYHNFVFGRILAHLKDSGLKRVDIESADAFGIMTWTKGDEDEALQAFEDAMHFMLDEGVIRASKVQSYDGGFVFNQVQLTSRGLEILKLQDQSGVTVAAKLEAAATGKSEAGNWGKIGELAGSFLASFTKTISSG